MIGKGARPFRKDAGTGADAKVVDFRDQVAERVARRKLNRERGAAIDDLSRLSIERGRNAGSRDVQVGSRSAAANVGDRQRPAASSRINERNADACIVDLSRNTQGMRIDFVDQIANRRGREGGQIQRRLLAGRICNCNRAQRNALAAVVAAEQSAATDDLALEIA